MTEKNPLKVAAHYVNIDADQSGRRIDNFLISYLKDIPKIRVYQMLRKGEVRINSARKKQYYKLQAGDCIRIPPVYTKDNSIFKETSTTFGEKLQQNFLYEDEHILILNKLSGLAVHGGTQQKSGLIETLREIIPNKHKLELVHRLDKVTSGCLIIARNHQVTRLLNQMIKEGKILKTYVALIRGSLGKNRIYINLPVSRNRLSSGERKVFVDKDGKQAQSIFSLNQSFDNSSLVEVNLVTGRTHQIRVHAAHIGHPIAGDDKYGDRSFNKLMKGFGLKRMFLHAKSLSFIHPVTLKKININAPLPPELEKCLINCNK